MKKERLLDIIKSGLYNTDFEVDGVGMTWGVSYVRFVIGQKSNYNDVEHFFYSTIKSNRNMTSMVQGGQSWDKRVDIEKWALGLTFESIPNLSFISFIESSIKEINANLHDWTEENTIDISKLTFPNQFDNCLILRETTYPRHIINSTQTYLGETPNKYYCVEGHWES